MGRMDGWRGGTSACGPGEPLILPSKVVFLAVLVFVRRTPDLRAHGGRGQKVYPGKRKSGREKG